MRIMARRKIIEIDESLCNGCGNCITSCAEGAIEMINGKARVVSDRFCDGLGACLKECPAGALTIVEREAEEFDEKAAEHHKLDKGPTIPCQAAVSISPRRGGPSAIKTSPEDRSQLMSWPIQMRLVPAIAPYLKGASLLIAADCTGFACPGIHEDFLKGRIALVGCPKLDDRRQYVEKLSEILRSNEIKDITVLHMEVPCCSNLLKLVSDAIKLSGKSLPVRQFVVGIRGDISC